MLDTRLGVAASHGSKLAILGTALGHETVDARPTY
jgi:hypothetical protein